MSSLILERVVERIKAIINRYFRHQDLICHISFCMASNSLIDAWRLGPSRSPFVCCRRMYAKHRRRQAFELFNGP